MRIVTRVLFGDHLAGRADAIGEALAPGLDYATQPALRQFPHPLPVGRRHAARRARAATDRVVDAAIAQRRALPVDDGNDILGAYMPFGAGVRKGIGFALAQMEIQLVVSRLAQRLDLEPAFTGAPAAEGMVTSRPVGGVPVTIPRPPRPGAKMAA